MDLRRWTAFGTLGPVQPPLRGRWRRGALLVLVTALFAAAPAVPAAEDDTAAEPAKTWITGWATSHVRQDGGSPFTMAAVPLQTAKHVPQCSANAASNASTSGPRMN
jgi:hypothetical protein